MPPAARDLTSLLRDLAEWAEESSEFVAGRAPDWLLADRTAELALTRLIEVTGEIAGLILRNHPAWCRERDVDDLVSAYRMRNRLAHGYEDVRADLLFDVADHHMIGLTRQARAWLAEIEADDT